MLGDGREGARGTKREVRTERFLAMAPCMVALGERSGAGPTTRQEMGNGDGDGR